MTVKYKKNDDWRDIVRNPPFPTNEYYFPREYRIYINANKEYFSVIKWDSPTVQQYKSHLMVTSDLFDSLVQNSRDDFDTFYENIDQLWTLYEQVYRESLKIRSKKMMLNTFSGTTKFQENLNGLKALVKMGNITQEEAFKLFCDAWETSLHPYDPDRESTLRHLFEFSEFNPLMDRYFDNNNE